MSANLDFQELSGRCCLSFVSFIYTSYLAKRAAVCDMAWRVRPWYSQCDASNLAKAALEKTQERQHALSQYHNLIKIAAVCDGGIETASFIHVDEVFRLLMTQARFNIIRRISRRMRANMNKRQCQVRRPNNTTRAPSPPLSTMSSSAAASSPSANEQAVRTNDYILEEKATAIRRVERVCQHDTTSRHASSWLNLYDQQMKSSNCRHLHHKFITVL